MGLGRDSEFEHNWWISRSKSIPGRRNMLEINALHSHDHSVGALPDVGQVGVPRTHREDLAADALAAVGKVA